MKTVKQLIECGDWEEFYLTDKKEKLPKTPENEKTFLECKVKWSSVAQKIEK